MVAPVIASKSSRTEISNVTSLTLTAPSGIADGDVLLIVIALDGDPTAFVNQSGGGAWVQISPVNGDKAPVSRATLYVIYKIASGEAGNYTTTWTNAQQGQGFMYRITGAIGGDEVQDLNNLNSLDTDPSTALSFLTDSADTLALAFHAIDADRITNGQADGGIGWTTEDIIESGGSTGAACGVSRKTIGVIAFTLDSTQALSLADEWATRQIVIRSIAPVAAPIGQAESGTIGNMIFGFVSMVIVTAHFIKGIFLMNLCSILSKKILKILK